MKHTYRWDNLTSPELEALAKKNAIVLLPTGSTEQHGPHLPVGCDAILATAMSERIAQTLCARKIPCVVAPSISVANSFHHMPFAGSLTLKPETYMQMLLEICCAIASHGFRRIAIVNGHGGNNAPTQAALVNINETLGFPVYFMSYSAGAPDIEAQVLTTQKHTIHACEGETSIMLAIDETLVDPIYKETKGETRFANPYEEDGTLSTYHRWSTNTKNGVLGTPSEATKEKGERIVDAMVRGLADVLADEKLWKVKL